VVSTRVLKPYQAWRSPRPSTSSRYFVFHLSVATHRRQGIIDQGIVDHYVVSER
jgi:hypothetical protein